VRPIAPDPIVVLDSDASSGASALGCPKTIKWDPAVRTAAVIARSQDRSTSPPARPQATLAIPTTRSLPRPRFEARPWVDDAETMRLPAGATEEMLGEGQPPAGPLEGRIAMTRLSRELGREYRWRYGAPLTVDAGGIEAIQHHLLRRLAEARCDERSRGLLDSELTRHGAFLSELLARRFGAEWLELGDGHPTDWCMRIGPSFRVWPVWRIHNFLRLAWDGRGALATFYTELRARLARR
jgi:hypothetical protein